jgi:ectoine hydroxylase-related dioxygenase (phytanoyl-CoA dioxygenase family)
MFARASSGRHLFEENDGDASTVESLDGSLPVHCITVFVPLVDLCDENGPTEFFPSTQRCSGRHRQAAMATLWSKFSVKGGNRGGHMGDSKGVEQGGAGAASNRGAEGGGDAGETTEGGVRGLTFNAAAGSAILFDYRILHRGLANTSSLNRPMLYFTYGRQWFRDATNYPALSIWE